MGIVITLAGMFIIVPLVMFLVFFTGNIIFTDTLIISILAGVLLNTRTGLHPVFCILAGAILFIGITALYMREKVFWVFATASTLSWGYLAGFLANDIIGDQIWGIFLGAAMSALTLALHIAARNKLMGI